jgi:uncharacterized membrane protein YkvA (DUF1232 family)
MLDSDFIKRSSASVTAEDLARVEAKAKEIGAAFLKNRPLRRFIKESVLLIGLVRDYAAGRYRAVPWWAIAAATFTLLYVFNPFDVVPEFIPVVGTIDDATVVAALVAMISHELKKYGIWKKEHADAS